MFNESTPNPNGTTFGSKKWSTSKGQRVWRKIDEPLPGGGTIVNFAQFVESGVIPCASPVVFDRDTHTIVVVRSAAYDATAKYAVGDTCANGGKLYKCKTAITTPEAFTSSKWEEIKAISGYLQEDVVVGEETTAASGTVIIAGMLYAYMFDATLLKIIEPISPAKITFVN